MINYYRQTEPLNRIDYFDSIEYFFSEHLRGIIRMDKSDLLNENWVYCDRVIFANNSCALNRHMAVMTGTQNNFFQLSYFKELKNIDCDEWENINELSENQKKELDLFVDDFYTVIAFSKYKIEPSDSESLFDLNKLRQSEKLLGIKKVDIVILGLVDADHKWSDNFRIKQFKLYVFEVKTKTVISKQSMKGDAKEELPKLVSEALNEHLKK